MTAPRSLPRPPVDDRFSTKLEGSVRSNLAALLPRGRTARRLALGVMFWLAIFVMAFPAATTAVPASAFGSSASPAQVAPAHAAAHPAAPHAASHESAPGASSIALPGSNPRANSKPAGGQVKTVINSNEKRFASLVGTVESPSNLTTSPSSLLSSATPLAPAAPHPGVFVPTGSFYGYLYNSETGNPVVGATVQAYSVSGSNCPANTPFCAPVVTTNNGSFTVVGPVGLDYITFSAPWYIGNVTYATATNATRTSIGTIYIVESAIIKGIVKSDTPPNDGPIAGVTVSDAPVDLAYLVSPTEATLNNGSFQIAGADAPSLVTFTPPAGLFLSNFTWTNATPGEVVNIGTIYLERLTEVKMNLTSAVNYQALASNYGGLPDLWFRDQGVSDICSLTAACVASLQMCTLSGGCGATEQGLTVFEATSGATVVTAFAVPGADYAVIEATGYMYDQVTLTHVPKEAPGHVWWAPPQNLTPSAAVNVTIGIDGNDVLTGSGAADDLGNTGMWTITACTQNGLDSIGAIQNQRTGLWNTTKGSCQTAGCAPVNSNTTFLVAPLRDYITVQPDTAGICDGGPPTWLITGFAPPAQGQKYDDGGAQVPVWSNTTWFNATPGMVTNLGWLNLTVGTYIKGNVTVQGTDAAPKNGYSVTVSSLNYPSLTTYAFDSNGSFWATWACGSAPLVDSSQFCAPAPPGPDLVTVSAVGYPNNFTWAATPENYFDLPNLTSLGQAQNDFQSQVNLTAGGTITANITQNGTNFGIPLAAVRVCSILPTYPVGCTTGSTNLQGVFKFAAPLGWDYVQVAASGYAPDFVWAYVNASFALVHLGNIGLQPLAVLTGRVVTPNGEPVLGATAQYCGLTTPIGAECTNLGGGRVSSSGVYLGTVIGGWLPWSTYRIQVSAAGYTSNWAWANATAGQTTNVSQIVLSPSGSNGTSAEPLRTASSGPSNIQVNTWLVGEIVDNTTGWGVTTGNVQACPAAGGPCDVLSSTGTNTGGFFNMTIPAGLYYLNITAEGYEPSSTFFNSSGASYYNLGPIALDPLPWVSGTTQIDPWTTLSTNISSTKAPDWVPFSMGPYASVSVCTTVTLTCAVSSNTLTSQNGSFTVWGEYAARDTLKVSPAAPGASSSATGGYILESTNITIAAGAGNYTLGAPIRLPIFASVTFNVTTNNSWMKSSLHTSPPVRYATVSITTVGANTANVGATAGGGGQVTFFIPPLNPAGATFIVGKVQGAWEQGVATIKTQLEPGMSYYASNLSLIHFGWEVGTAVTNKTFQPAPYLGVAVTSTPLHSTIQYSSNANTNGGGFFNVSVAPAYNAKFTIGPGNDYNSATFYAEANYSNTSAYRSSTLTPKNVSLDHWGYLSSTQVNYSGFPVVSTVLDHVKGLPIPDVSLAVSTVGDNESSLTALPESNDGGQFLVDAPPGADWANYTRSVYQSNDTRVNILASGTHAVRNVNLTGDGVIAARIVSEPGNQPVASANVTACLGGQLVCGTSETNSSGVFWMNATAGENWINVTANGFIPAGPTVAEVCSDCFVALPQIEVFQPAFISGIVLGLPEGRPVPGANVSACSPLGVPTGPCLYTVQTHSSGSFLLDVPAGSYVLAMTDPYFNATYLSINVHAGEHVNVGTQFLEAFGEITGAVYSNTTISPVGGADVLACPVWSGSSCVGTTTGANGRYSVYGPPGAFEITVSASGYQDTILPVTLVGGQTTVAPTVFLVPLGTGGSFPVSGVVDANGAGLSGAIVAATTGGVVAASTSTGSGGAFSFLVPYGTYTLLVSSAGEASNEVPLTVHGPVSGIVVSLSTQTYAVTGLVSDGLTGQPLAGVQILVGTTIAATTNATGRYAVELANGSYTITAEYAGSSAVEYGSEQVAVTVEGSAVPRDIQMFPVETVVFGIVVDSASGAPLAGAAVVIAGTAADGHRITMSLTTSPAGSFQVSLPAGQYEVSGTYGGYANATVSFHPNGATEPLTVGLASTTLTTRSPGTSSSSAWLDLGVLAAVVIGLGVVGTVVMMRRSSKGGGSSGASGGTP